jgi:hypothetical protein
LPFGRKHCRPPASTRPKGIMKGGEHGSPPGWMRRGSIGYLRRFSLRTAPRPGESARLGPSLAAGSPGGQLGSIPLQTGDGLP